MTETTDVAAAAASSSTDAKPSEEVKVAEAPADAKQAEAPATAAPATVAPAADAKAPSRSVNLIKGPEGEIMGFSISPVAQLYAMVDQLVASPKLVALPVEQRFALAGKVAAVPAEFARLVERLASAVATSITEAGALNALYLLETCKELVPGFKDAIPDERLQKAAELSPHERVQAAVLLGQKPPEWEWAAKQAAPSSVVLLRQEEEGSLLDDAGRAVGDATKFVGGSALGGVGLITDTLGVTQDAEGQLAEAAEDAVDLVGESVSGVVTTIDDGINGTADDFAEKGIAGTVGDGMADAVDMVTDFVGDAVHGIAGGVRGALDFLTGEDSSENTMGTLATHKVAIVVGELFGEERTLGLRIENRVVTKFTRPEAEKMGWRAGDCIVAVGPGLVATQEAMLAAIGAAKEALKTNGTPIRFLVERLGSKPAGPKRGDLVFVSGRAARVQGIEPQTGAMTVQFQDDGSLARVAGGLR